MSRQNNDHRERWMRPEDVARECILVVPAAQVKGLTVAMAPLGTLSWEGPCVVVEEEPYGDDGPVLVLDRRGRPITGETIDAMAANARELGLVVSRVLCLPPNVDEARLDALGLKIRSA